jgi:hypothetical protein
MPAPGVHIVIDRVGGAEVSGVEAVPSCSDASGVFSLLLQVFGSWWARTARSAARSPPSRRRRA